MVESEIELLEFRVGTGHYSMDGTLSLDVPTSNDGSELNVVVNELNGEHVQFVVDGIDLASVLALEL